MKIIKIGAIWCPACLIMNKIWKQIKLDYSNLDIKELDYDMDSDEVSVYNPGKVLPVVIFLDKNGSELERIIGEVSKEQLEEKINEYEKN